MERYELQIGNRKYTIVMNDKTNMILMKLKRLYSTSYEDIDSFDEISNAISDSINELKKYAITPEPTGEDLDKIIQELFKFAEKRVKESR
ncbi:MAG: hypothetical protein QW416_06785 [Candidatus Nitrosocaldaceae archaeon]